MVNVDVVFLGLEMLELVFPFLLIPRFLMMMLLLIFRLRRRVRQRFTRWGMEAMGESVPFAWIR